MSKNKKVMSIAILPELQEEIKKFSKRKGATTSSYIGSILEQVVKLNPDDDLMIIGRSIDDDVVPVMLKIPVALKSNPDKLKTWMDVQTAGIVKSLTKHLSEESA